MCSEKHVPFGATVNVRILMTGRQQNQWRNRRTRVAAVAGGLGLVRGWAGKGGGGGGGGRGGMSM